MFFPRARRSRVVARNNTQQAGTGGIFTPGACHLVAHPSLFRACFNFSKKPGSRYMHAFNSLGIESRNWPKPELHAVQSKPRTSPLV